MTKQSQSTQLAVMARDVSYIREEITDMKGRLDGNYVTKSEFEPVKRVVYGMVGLILTAVVLAVIALVVNQ